MPLYLYAIQCCIEGPNQCKKKRNKEIKCIHIEKKYNLFTENMIVYIENPWHLKKKSYDNK